MPEEDLHLSDLACSQAHSPAIYRWVRQCDWKQSAQRTTENIAFTYSAVRFAD